MNRLSNTITSNELSLMPNDNRRLMNLCGRFDEHLRLIEQRLGVEIHNRGNNFNIMGESKAVEATHELLRRLYRETENAKELTPHRIHLALQETEQSFQPELDKKPLDKQGEQTPQSLDISTKRGFVKPRSKNQAQYISNILQYDMNFGIGPAGTGKTFLAVACAVRALEMEEVRRILLVRPAVEAGERLGFLPGDLSQKIDPYLRPLFDALYEMLGFERTLKLIERHVIEVAPLAYMRGRTLNDAFVILDESQNTTVEQMKMFLTRIGFSSKAVITGDITQIDLPRGDKSGLNHVIDVLRDVDGIKFNYFETTDVIRHPLVQKIVEAYDKHEKGSSGKQS